MGRKIQDNNRVSAILEPGVKTWILKDCERRGISIGQLVNSCLKWYKDTPKNVDGSPMGIGFKPLSFSHERDDGMILIPSGITPDDLKKAAQILEVMDNTDEKPVSQKGRG